MRSLRVLIAEDHPLYLDGLVATARSTGDIDAIMACADGHEALARIRAERPDVAVVGLRIPGKPATEILGELIGLDQRPAVLVMSPVLQGDEIIACLELGAAGLMAKRATRSEIVEAIRAVARGEAVLCRHAQTRLAREIRRRGAARQEALTRRERDVLEMLASGASAPAVARELFVSPATVRTHLRHMYAKLGVSDRAAAVAEGMRRGLIE